MTTNEGSVLEHEHITSQETLTNSQRNEISMNLRLQNLRSKTFVPAVRGAQPHDTHVDDTQHCDRAQTSFQALSASYSQFYFIRSNNGPTVSLFQISLILIVFFYH